MIAFAAKSQSEEFKSFDEILDLVRRFEDGSLPKAQWTHRAHLTVACWYLVAHPGNEAIRKIREGIKSYNKSQGVVTTPKSGYHETMTLFWAKMIRAYLSTTTLECSIIHLVNRVTVLYSSKDLPFEYYSREYLMSGEARADWVEPDLKPLP